MLLEYFIKHLILKNRLANKNSMKYLLLAILGIACSLLLLRVLKTSMANRPWIFPMLLAALPLFYFVFALWVNDKSAMKNEFLVTLLFFTIIFVYLRYRSTWSEYLLAAGFIAHALYDSMHDLMFINAGTPEGWAVFCGVINLFVGCFLVYQVKNRRNIARLNSP